jgi:hypothetical protein
LDPQPHKNDANMQQWIQLDNFCSKLYTEITNKKEPTQKLINVAKNYVIKGMKLYILGEGGRRKLG